MFADQETKTMFAHPAVTAGVSTRCTNSPPVLRSFARVCCGAGCDKQGQFRYMQVNSRG
jgi:hypothetical protein